MCGMGSVIAEGRVSSPGVFGVRLSAQSGCKTHYSCYCCVRRPHASTVAAAVSTLASRTASSSRSDLSGRWNEPHDYGSFTAFAAKPVVSVIGNRHDRSQRLSIAFSWETGTIFEPFRHKGKRTRSKGLKKITDKDEQKLSKKNWSWNIYNANDSLEEGSTNTSTSYSKEGGKSASRRLLHSCRLCIGRKPFPIVSIRHCSTCVTSVYVGTESGIRIIMICLVARSGHSTELFSGSPTSGKFWQTFHK